MYKPWNVLQPSKKEILTHATAWLYEDITLSKINQSQKKTCCIIPLIYMRYIEQPGSQKQKVEWWLPRAGGRGKGGVAI